MQEIIPASALSVLIHTSHDVITQTSQNGKLHDALRIYEVLLLARHLQEEESRHAEERARNALTSDQRVSPPPASFKGLMFTALLKLTLRPCYALSRLLTDISSYLSSICFHAMPNTASVQDQIFVRYLLRSDERRERANVASFRKAMGSAVQAMDAVDLYHRARALDRAMDKAVRKHSVSDGLFQRLCLPLKHLGKTSQFSVFRSAFLAAYQGFETLCKLGPYELAVEKSKWL